MDAHILLCVNNCSLSYNIISQLISLSLLDSEAGTRSAGREEANLGTGVT